MGIRPSEGDSVRHSTAFLQSQVGKWLSARGKTPQSKQKSVVIPERNRE